MESNVFEEIKASANGMLPVEVYERIFETAKSSEGGAFVEIGTAHGASTIAMALGAIQSGKSFHIYTCDPIISVQGSFASRASFGSTTENVTLIRSHFQKFNVDQHITVVVGTCAELLEQAQIDKIDLLMLDADGRIDRDIKLLFDKLTPNCPIIIDDIDNAVYIKRVKGVWRVDQKHRLSYLLTELFMEMGLLKDREIVRETGFFRKGDCQLPGDIEVASIRVYRDLVFAQAKHLDISGIKEYATKTFPGLYGIFKSVSNILKRSREA